MPYDPKAVEDKIYQLWQESGHFQPQGEGPVFSLVLPPPNVTGDLHMGHAAMVAIQDILTRWHRMRGFKTLWLPGTDHAAIATQSKIEGIIYKKEGKTRHDLGREEFLRRVEEFAQQSHDTIVGQIKKLGGSLDWSREAYTLDKQRSRAVVEAFRRMHDAGLIYRGERIVNWDPKLQTTVSDDEVVYQEETATLYHLQYGPFVIATARPETKFGDKYVVMHPQDGRYTQYKHGEQFTAEWINGPVTATVIKDETIDPEFGTGVMTITPWHDATDFAIAERHDLAREQIIDLRGLLLPTAGEFAGQHIKKARPLIVEKLKAKGLVVKTDENYQHRVATSERGGAIIEPQILKQWFVGVNKEFERDGKKTTLKQIMREAVESGRVQIIPERFNKIYFHWIDNLRDWCISRQIWYGHKVPMEGETDTLDTWFSSGLWTFSTLGWPDQTEDLKNYHPTTVLETGYDILFFWVARMILMTGFLLNDVPFKKVYLHGLVRDESGQKMSKSKGNIIDPLDMISEFGADAVRMSLIIGTSPGADSRISPDKIKAYKHFANKIWNASRFVMSHWTEITVLNEVDQKYLTELNNLVIEINADMQNFRFYLAGEKLYHYFWHTFADKIMEEVKERLKAGPDPSGEFVLREILVTTLKLLHPFMPFVTEHIWSQLPDWTGKKMLIVESWPSASTT